MKVSKLKKLVLIMCLSAFVFILTGCSETLNTNVKITSASTANCTVSFGIDDELLEAYASAAEISSSELIKQFTDAGFTYSKKTSNGVEYNMFSASVKKAKISEVEELLATMGYSNVCLTKNYFYATYDPDAISNSALSSLATTYSDTLDDYNMSLYLKLSIQLNSKIKTTNGKLASGSKKVSWTVKNPDKKKNFYASTAKVKATAKTSSVKNNKTYKAGKKIKVSNASSLVRMTLDGKTVKNNVAVKKKGSHTVTIWSKNGKVQNVTFKIK